MYMGSVHWFVKINFNSRKAAYVFCSSCSIFPYPHPSSRLNTFLWIFTQYWPTPALWFIQGGVFQQVDRYFRFAKRKRSVEVRNGETTPRHHLLIQAFSPLSPWPTTYPRWIFTESQRINFVHVNVVPTYVTNNILSNIVITLSNVQCLNTVAG